MSRTSYRSLISQREFDEAIETFEAFLTKRLELRKPLQHHQPPLTSGGSKRIYLAHVKKFLNDMGFQYGLPFDSDVARQYLAILRGRGIKPRTLLVVYSALKNFYVCMGWDFDMDYHEILSGDINTFSEEPYLTMKEIKKVVSYAEKDAEKSNYYRDVVIIHLLQQAMRPSEIAGLRVENLSKLNLKKSGREAYKITYVPVKRGAKTVKILGARATYYMDKWLEQLREELPPKLIVLESIRFDPDFSLPDFLPLFPRYIGRKSPKIKYIKDLRKIKPIGYQSIYLIVKRMVIEALGRTEEVYRKAHPYAFRRGMITYRLDPEEAGEDYRPPHEIEAWVGWKTSGMYKIYDKRAKEKVAEKFSEIKLAERFL